MKLSKNLMRLLQVNSMTAIAADRLSPRNLTSRMFRHLYALLLLAVMTIAGSGNAWGQLSLGKAEIKAAPNSTTGTQTIDDQGDVKAWYENTTAEEKFIAQNGANQLDGKWFIKLANNGFIKIRVAKGSVVAGDILRVETIDIYQNADNQNLGFKVAGSNGYIVKQETDNEVHTLDYILAAEDIQSEDASYDYIQIDRNDNSGCGYHSVEILKSVVDLTVGKTGLYNKWTTIEENSELHSDSNNDSYNPGELNLNKDLSGDGALVYGTGSVWALHYAKLTGYDKIHVEGPDGMVLRFLFNRSTDNSSDYIQKFVTIASGEADLDLRDCYTNSYCHLNAIKVQGGGTGKITSLQAIKNNSATYTVTWNASKVLSGALNAWYTIGDDETQIKETRTDIAPGTKITYHANNGSSLAYAINGWREGDGEGTWLGYGQTWTVNSIDRDLNIWPEFREVHYYVADASEGGTAKVYTNTETKENISGNKIFDFTTNAYFEATPKVGYAFTQWEDGNTENPRHETIPHVMNQTTTHIAQFTRTASGYIINFSANDSKLGSVSALAGGQEIESGADIRAGTKVILSAVPAPGKIFWYWDINGVRNYNEKTVEVTANADLVAQAEFQDGIHVRVYTNNANLGTVMIENSGKSATDFHVTTYPGKFTFKATEVGRGVFTGWYNNVDLAEEHRVSTEATYTTPEGGEEGGIKEADYNLWAHFESGYQVNANVSPSGLKPTITIHQEDHDDWTIANHDYVLSGTTAVFSVNDVTGYTFDGWYKDGVKVESATQANYDFGSVTEDVNLVAKFTKTGSVSSVAADFTDRGKGGNLTWENGVLTANGTSDNWANIFVFPKSSNTEKCNVTNDADKYSGFTITARGEAYRIIIYYNDENGANKQKEISGSATDAIQRFEWSDFEGLSGTDVTNIKRIAVAGTTHGENGRVTTFSNAYLYKDVTTSLDFTSVGNTKGSNATWTVESDKATLQSSGASDNMKYIYDFTEDGNMKGHSASEFTGIRFNSTGDRFRVIVYVDNGKDAEDKQQYKRFIGYVTNTGTGTDPKTQHFQWKDLQIQWGADHMTDADVAKVMYIAVGGDDAGSGHGKVVLQNVWLDNINDYDHTFVCYGEENSKPVGHETGWTYDYTQNGSTASVELYNGGGRDADGCIKLSADTKVTITSPSEFSYITKVKIIFADGSVETPAVAENTAKFVYTNGSKTKYIAKIEYSLTQASHSKSHTITSSEISRDYWLYVPTKVLASNDATKYPVVFSLHGTSNDYEPTNGGVQNFNELAEANDFIVVYPRGRMLEFPKFGSGKLRGWEATGKNNEDIQFFKDIIEDLKTNANLLATGANLTSKINEQKIYITGFSNGGMMAYAAANAASDVFAAFASISGYPINEMHLRTHGPRAVPFLHIHGTKDDFVRYDLVHTIVDNMLTRNGLPYTPTSTVENGNAKVYGTATKYNKYEYTADGCKPFIYYTVGTGMTASDTGLGHNKECEINGVDSKKIIWDFFAGKTLDSSDSDIEFKSQISVAKSGKEQQNYKNEIAREHGWTVSDGRMLAQYGESGGYTAAGQNVYHTIQLNAGDHYLKFNATGNEGNFIVARIAKLGNLSNFNTLPSANFNVVEEVVLNDEAYDAKGDICIQFTTTVAGEYMLSFTKGNQYDYTVINGVEISKTGTPTPEHKHQGEASTDFTGYYNYNNRLFAQWNFDLCDGSRFDGKKIKELLDDGDASNNAWEADLSNTNYNGNGEATNGTIIYKYIKPLGTQGELTDEQLKQESNYGQLTYSGGTDYVPVSAGLKFIAPANSVKVYVDIANGQVTGTHLVVNENVKMLVPYVKNSFRNDLGSVNNPTVETKGDFENCMHHIHRDILYVALNQGTVWDTWHELAWDEQGKPTKWRKDIGHVKNVCIGHDDEIQFASGGEEFVNDKHYFKMDYRGFNGEPCIMQFTGETIIDRLGVNRNLIYSFYTEYINEMGVSQPYPRMRIVGVPSGQRVASIGDSEEKLKGAIAMTYGGWMNKNNSSTYTSYNSQTENDVTDGWDELGVFNGQAATGGADVFVNFSNMAAAPKSNVSAAIDGFPVLTKTFIPASSGAMMPEHFSSIEATVKSEDNRNVPNYHPTNSGRLHDTYIANKTPWSLPSRGAYVKYEPSVPGVLNIDVVQIGNKDYHLVDEFGKLVSGTVYSRAASGQSVTNDGNGTFSVVNTDYVKHTINVYPGKTYYFFSNDAGMGNVGFYFEPNVEATGEFDRIEVGMKTVTLSPTANYTYPTGLDETTSVQSPGTNGNVNYTIHYSHKAAKVTLDRAFKAKKWNTICLPFSMNQVALEDAFGVGTRVIMLRDIQSSANSASGRNECSFICHENQDIIAGYPYFIMPTKAISKIETFACFDNYAEYTGNAAQPIPSLVTVSSKGPSIYNYATEPEVFYNGLEGYTFRGCFAQTHVPDGSYYVNANDGKLYRLKTANGQGSTMNPYRVWLDYDGEPRLAPKSAIGKFVNYISGEEAEDEATGIDLNQVLEAQGIFTNKPTVYSVDGQVVREKADNLNGLPKGIYIVNGRKHAVK